MNWLKGRKGFALNKIKKRDMRDIKGNHTFYLKVSESTYPSQ